jgi:hypothetical protein
VTRYAERMTRMCESQNATIAIMAKQIADQSELLCKRKKTKKGKELDWKALLSIQLRIYCISPARRR